MPNPLTYSARATKYARDVVAGKVLACEYVRLACARHIADLKKSASKEYPYKFDGTRGDKVCKFAENMVHIKGIWTGDLIVLEDWQCFLLAVPFGWVRKSDDLRRFRELFALIPRKNGKSMLGAMIGLYMLLADDEQGAEVYAGATSEKQALEVFRPAWLMADRNPEFKNHFGLELGGSFKNPLTIFQAAKASRFERVIGKPGDGASPSCAIIDEYHEHKTSEMYDTMDTGRGARTQPMKVVISTAGTDTSVPCYDLYLEAIKILEGTRERDTTFAIIFGVDKDDDWTDFTVWRKANPNIGVSVFEDFLREQYQAAMQDAGKQNIILCKHLNQWSNAGEAWMNMAKWGECEDATITMESCAEYPCWLGLDLASKIDICSLVILFKLPDYWVAYGRHYLPESTVRLSENDHYQRWAAQKWLTPTEGDRTDFHKVEADIKEIAANYRVKELAYDEHEAAYLMDEIRVWADFEVVPMKQGPALMSEPMKEVEAIIAAHQFRHVGDPVLTWMMGNVVRKQARGGGPVKYYYPTKQAPENKIDGAVALIMALGRGMVSEGQEPEYQAFFVGK